MLFRSVHSQRILQQSSNNFNALLPTELVDQALESGQLVVTVSNTAATLNIVLHTIYEWPCAAFAPPFGDVMPAITALKIYGLSLKECLAPEKPLRSLLLSFVPIYPMEIYAMAASNGLEELAVIVSSHLLSYRMHDLSDELAAQMGATYLHRLAILHTGRMQTLKKLVLCAPDEHEATETCGFTEKNELSGMWALASAHLSWEAKSGVLLPVCFLIYVLGLITMA